MAVIFPDHPTDGLAKVVENGGIAVQGVHRGGEVPVSFFVVGDGAEDPPLGGSGYSLCDLGQLLLHGSESPLESDFRVIALGVAACRDCLPAGTAKGRNPVWSRP